MSEQLSHKEIFQAHAELFSPTATEVKILKEHEEKVSFILVPYEGISKGHQARVSLLEYRVFHEPHFVIWKRMGAGKGLTDKETSRMGARLGSYRKSVEAYGWKTPRPFWSGFVVVGGEAEIFSYEEFIRGGDGEKMFENPDEPNFKKWFLLRKVAELLAAYPQQSVKRESVLHREMTLLPHGIDLKPANIVLNERGDLYLVDLFGPKEIAANGDWVSYSEKLESLSPEKLTAVCATREGALLRFYRLAEKMWQKATLDNANGLRSGFKEILISLALPKKELDFIAAEVDSGFRWLDEIYREVDM